MNYGAVIHGRKYRSTSYFAGFSDPSASAPPMRSSAGIAVAGALSVGFVLGGLITGVELLKLDVSKPAPRRRRRYA